MWLTGTQMSAWNLVKHIEVGVKALITPPGVISIHYTHTFTHTLYCSLKSCYDDSITDSGWVWFVKVSRVQRGGDGAAPLNLGLFACDFFSPCGPAVTAALTCCADFRAGGKSRQGSGWVGLTEGQPQHLPNIRLVFLHLPLCLTPPGSTSRRRIPDEQQLDGSVTTRLTSCSTYCLWIC